MKNTYFFCLPLFFLFLSCSNPIPLKKAKPMDYGKISGNKYENDYFGFKVNLPEYWVLEPMKKNQTSFAPHLLEADFYEGNDKGQLKFSLNITAEKLNPFKKDEKIETILSENNEVFKSVYSEEEFFYDDFKNVSLGKRKFTLNHVVIVPEGSTDTLYMDEYAAIHENYCLSITFSYGPGVNREVKENALKQFEFK